MRYRPASQLSKLLSMQQNTAGNPERNIPHHKQVIENNTMIKPPAQKSRSSSLMT
jgi:hypothetical protein